MSRKSKIPKTPDEKQAVRTARDANLLKMPELPAFLARVKSKEHIRGAGTEQVEVLAQRGDQRVFRRFDKSYDARMWWKALTAGYKPSFNADGHRANFVDGTVVISNMPIPDFLIGKKIPRLPHLMTGSAEKLAIRVVDKLPPIADEPTVETMLGKGTDKAKHRTSGTLIPLKVICGEVGVDPRVARIKLRKAVKDKAKYPDLVASHAHHARWEWEAESKALDDVKRAIK